MVAHPLGSDRVSANLAAARLVIFVAVLGCGLGARIAEAAATASPPESQAAPAEWFHILKLGRGNYAISEPKYWQQNVSYLILGDHSGVLFDTGPGLYSIRQVVEKLTRLPVLVIPSHLHFDHVGRIQEFPNVALLDLPDLRHQARTGILTETPGQYMLSTSHVIRVSRWVRDGEILDLGGRRITVLSTPGHTPDSVSLVDRANQLLFTGDLVNRMVTLCDVPGSDIRETANSLERLESKAPEGSLAYEAHSEKPITWNELKMLAQGARQIAQGRLQSKSMCLGGLPMQQYTVGTFLFVLPASSDVRLQPLSSATQTLEWAGSTCNSLTN
jgi:glyoxylase-like metal-dependent hydrolase (beta-lactamase superfamily II)